MNNEVVMVHDGNEVKIREAGNDQRVVVKDGLETTFTLDMEDIITIYKSNGWELKSLDKNLVQDSVEQNNTIINEVGTPETKEESLDSEVLESLDKYLELHKEQAKLKKEMDKHKKKVKAFMEENKLDELEGIEEEGRVVFQKAKKSLSTSLYSEYDYNDVAGILGKYNQVVILNQIAETRVNSEKLEGVIKAGLVSEDVGKELKEAKINPGESVRMVVKR